MIENSKTSKEILEWIDARISYIFKAPKMWGFNLESIEFQIIQLLEIRDFLLGGENPRKILELYQKFIRTKFPQTPSSYLSSLTTSEEFYVLLKEFVKSIQEFHSC